MVDQSVCYDVRMTRQITKHYQDPVDVIWLHAACQCGIEVQRDPEVFASWDGNGVLRIGTPESLDADDSLAQMILHEICHALVAGPDGFDQEDWGLDYDKRSDQVFEHATIRLQAALADQYNLRSFFASTTDFRDYFNQLSEDPLTGDGDPASVLARTAIERHHHGPWKQPVNDALLRTAVIANTIASLVDDNSIWKRSV